MGKHTYLETLLVLPKLKCKFERRGKLRGLLFKLYLNFVLKAKLFILYTKYRIQIWIIIQPKPLF